MTASALQLVLGLFLGVAFFGGLWGTVKYGLRSNHPALWLGLSAVGRMGIVVVGLYYATQQGLTGVLACLGGVVIARIAVKTLLCT